MMEVGGEEAGGGEKFIFDHYVNIVVGETIAHVLYSWGFWGRRCGGGTSSESFGK